MVRVTLMQTTMLDVRGLPMEVGLTEEQDSDKK